jgi:hypothetical protein
MRYAALLLMAFLFAAGAPPQPEITYFALVRDVHIAQPDRQNFIVLDFALWNHSRPDLGDLRLYDGTSQVQYALSQQNAAVLSVDLDAKILNLGSVGGHTEFDLDVNNIAEYDRIRLYLDARNFVAKAIVAGETAPGQPSTTLAQTTLYDFSSQQLGSNFILKLPTSSFRYLHVRLSPGIHPSQVKRATLSDLRESKASWVSAGVCGTIRQQPRETEVICAVPTGVPLQRFQFQVDEKQVNFRREVTIEDSKGAQLGAGEISRVRMNRDGMLVRGEEMSLATPMQSGKFVLRVQNGDNPPLAILSVQPQALERRLYFDPQGKTLLKLYYGDSKLPPPIYDYARFFQKDDAAVQAQLGGEIVNPSYAGRPDGRPWSERHKIVLWAVMLAAVVILALLAIRGMQSQTAAS